MPPEYMYPMFMATSVDTDVAMNNLSPSYFAIESGCRRGRALSVLKWLKDRHCMFSTQAANGKY